MRSAVQDLEKLPGEIDNNTCERHNKMNFTTRLASHFFTLTRELILHLQTTQQLTYKGNRVLIFLDYTSEVKQIQQGSLRFAGPQSGACFSLPGTPHLTQG